jgi:hypothetical protein
MPTSTIDPRVAELQASRWLAAYRVWRRRGFYARADRAWQAYRQWDARLAELT